MMHIPMNPGASVNGGHRQQQQQQPTNLQNYYALQSSVQDAYLQAFPGISPLECRHFADNLLKRSFAQATQAKAAELQGDMEYQERKFEDQVHHEMLELKDDTRRSWADQYQKMGCLLAWNTLLLLPVMWMAFSGSPGDCFLQMRDSATAGADFLFVAEEESWVCPPQVKTTLASLLFLGSWFHKSACAVATVLLVLLLLSFFWCLWHWTQATVAFAVVAFAVYFWESFSGDAAYNLFAFLAIQLCIYFLVRTMWQLAVAFVLNLETTVGIPNETDTQAQRFVRDVVVGIHVVVIFLAVIVACDYSALRAITNEDVIVNPDLSRCAASPCLTYT